MKQVYGTVVDLCMGVNDVSRCWLTPNCRHRQLALNTPLDWFDLKRFLTLLAESGHEEYPFGFSEAPWSSDFGRKNATAPNFLIAKPHLPVP